MCIYTHILYIESVCVCVWKYRTWRFYNDVKISKILNTSTHRKILKERYKL